MAKIGSLIDSVKATGSTAAESRKAAVAADQKANDDQAAYEASQARLGSAIRRSGPITADNGDGTYSNYEPSTAGPGYRVETSKGVDADVADDPGDGTSTPTPAPAPAPVPPTPPTPVAPDDPGPAPTPVDPLPAPVPVDVDRVPAIPPPQAS